MDGGVPERIGYVCVREIRFACQREDRRSAGDHGLRGIMTKGRRDQGGGDQGPKVLTVSRCMSGVGASGMPFREILTKHSLNP